MRVTLAWRTGRRNRTPRHHHEIRRVLVAHRRGIRIVLGFYGRAEDAPSTPQAREDYCHFVRNVVVRYSEIRDVVIWNEANSDTFWRPRQETAEGYAALLARCWDLLHASVADVNVVTTTAASHDPIGFVQAVAAAYRASGRSRPLFDTVGHNPYAGHESVTGAVSGAGQAAQLATALRLAYCQPRVEAFFNFPLVDEPALGRWQSDLLWADWKRKPAFAAYRAAIAEVRDGTVVCAPAGVLGGEDEAPGNTFRQAPRPETARSASS
jgi:hypothetical protein